MATKAKGKKKEAKVVAPAEKEQKFDLNAMNKKEEFERKIRKFLKIVIGGLFCVGGAWLVIIFWQSFLQVFKQWVGVAVILVGLFVILLGLLD